MRILIAEDEKHLNNLIKKVLEKEGMSVDAAFDGEEAQGFIESASYDVIILDIMMPYKSGIEIVKEMRKKGMATPVLFLTARDAIKDRVEGLDSGADDYLIKPFDFEELLARIRALSRKYAKDKDPALRVGDLTLDTVTRDVYRSDRPIKLSAKEFAVLEYMMRHPGQVLSRTMIEENLYDFEFDGISNVIDVYISNLRKKIDSGFDKRLIHTIRGAGYMIKSE